MAKTSAKKTATTSQAKTAKQAPVESSQQASPPKAKAGKQASTDAHGSRSVPHEEIARLAYSLWEQDGRPHGQDKTYWSRAERELRGLGPQQPAR